jgi:hypothetical protein
MSSRPGRIVRSDRGAQPAVASNDDGGYHLMRRPAIARPRSGSMCKVGHHETGNDRAVLEGAVADVATYGGAARPCALSSSRHWRPPRFEPSAAPRADTWNAGTSVERGRAAPFRPRGPHRPEAVSVTEQPCWSKRSPAWSGPGRLGRASDRCTGTPDTEFSSCQESPPRSSSYRPSADVWTAGHLLATAGSPVEVERLAPTSRTFRH